VPGVEEGLNAGMWTVGLAMSGNEIGLPLKELEALAPGDREARRSAPTLACGSAAPTTWSTRLPTSFPCLDDIEARLSRGERP